VAKKVNSQALGIISRSLQMSGSPSPDTEFLDGTLDQTLDVGALVRRGNVLGDSGGIFRVVLRNLHASGASNEASSFQPYNTTLADLIAPWPTPMPAHFDLWLLNAMTRRHSGTGDALCSLTIQNVRQGVGVDSAGTPIASNPQIVLAAWNTTVAQSNIYQTEQTTGGRTLQTIGFRIPRVNESATDVDIFFASQSTATSNWEVHMFIGMFPVGLGQDGVV